MTTDFLPTDYDLPGGWNYYFKFQDWDNKIRFMSAPILWWRVFVEDWDKKKKILRPYKEQNPLNVPEWSFEDKWKHVWLCIVYNYNEWCVQAMELDKRTVQKEIIWLAKDLDFGSPLEYDIKITKQWQKMDTEYFVKPLSKSLFENKDAWDIAKMIDLEVMFDWWDPFEALKEWLESNEVDEEFKW